MKGAQRLLLPFLLLGIVSSVFSATCPPEKDDSPCICEEGYSDDADLHISCGYDGASLDDVKQALHSLDPGMTYSVELEKMDIGVLPHNFFEGLKVIQLTINHCELDSLAEDGKKALTGLENSLEELNIYFSFLEKNVNTKLDVSHLRVLSHLHLSDNSITELGNDWFENGPASLAHLILLNNGIETLGDRAFRSLVNITFLWIEGNRFGPIIKNMLPLPSNHLIDLQLGDNAFTSLPDDLFLGMPVLKFVSIQNNGISQIPQRLWLPVWGQLLMVQLRGNPLFCDSHIEWIFHTNTRAAVSGQCIGPRNRQGVDLEDLVNFTWLD